MISAKPNTPIATPTKPDAVGQFRDVEGEARDARVDVGADQAEQQAEHDHADRLDQRAGGQHDRADQAEHHQREVLGRPELERQFDQRRASAAISSVPTVPAKNEPMAAMRAPRRRGRAAPSGSRRGR
jgi:hypothetical protein